MTTGMPQSRGLLFRLIKLKFFYLPGAGPVVSRMMSAVS